MLKNIRFLLLVVSIIIALFIFKTINVQQASLNLADQAPAETIEHLSDDIPSLKNAQNIGEVLKAPTIKDQKINETQTDKVDSSEATISRIIAEDSKLHQTLMEQHLDNPAPTVIDFEGKEYFKYYSGLRVEFYTVDFESMKELPSGIDFYPAVYELQLNKLDNAGDHNAENELRVYSLFEQFNESTLQILALTCRGNVCLSRNSHPIDSVKVLGRFLTFIQESRESCACIGLPNFHHDMSESTVTFFFD